MNIIKETAALNGLVDPRTLSIKEKLEVKHLEQVERSVREHERSHLRAARDLVVNGPNYQYDVGPDGRKYAVHGEVNIDASVVNDNPADTIEKSLKIQRAALAPSDPSAKDLQAAARARILEAKAHRQLAREEEREAVMKKEEEQFQQLHPGSKVYQSNMALQEGLYQILDLFT